MLIFKRTEQLMKYFIVIALLFITHVCFSQTFINRAGAANTVIDQRLGAAQNFYLPRLMDTTLSGGKDTMGNLIYDRLRAKIAIRDTVLTGGHKFTFLFKTEDTLTTLATRYDLTQLSGTLIANNGLSQTVDSVQLGQSVGAVGSPAALHNDREIPLNGYRIGLSGTGSVGIGTSTPSASYKLTIVPTGSIGGINVTSGSSGTGVNASSTGNAIVGQSTGGSGTGVLGSTSTTGYGVRGVTGVGGIGGGFYTIAEGGDALPVVLELQRDPTGSGVTNGAGFTIMFRNGLTNGSTGNESGRITNYFSNAVLGTRTSAFGFHLMNNAVSARKALLAGDGQWTWDGYPALAQQTDTTNIKPIGYNTTTGKVEPMANWIGNGGGGSFTAGNGIDITNNVIGQLFMPLKSGSFIIGNSISMGCCPDGTYTTWHDTLSTSFLNGPTFNNLSISGIGVRKGAYQLFNNFGEDHANVPIAFEVGFNNTRILTDTAIHNATIQAAYRSMVASQFLIHIEGPNWGASGVNPNVTYSTASAPASSEDTLLNWQSRLWAFRQYTVNTGANWFNKESCLNDTITITNQIGSNLAFGTFGYAGSPGSQIKINIDGVDVVTYDPNNRTYTGQAEGFTPDGIIPDAIIITGLTNVAHTVKVIFLDNGKRGALDWFGTMCSPSESFDRPAYIFAFPHMNATGYSYPGGETTQGILDSATTGLKNMLQQTFVGYALAFVDQNASGFYDPSDPNQIDVDGIHATSEGQYNWAKAIYTKMLKTDKRGNNVTLDEVLTAGNTSTRSIILTGSGATESQVRFGSLEGQSFAVNNDWLADNIYFDGTNFKYRANGLGAQLYFNQGYFELKNAASGVAGATATMNLRMTLSPTGDVGLGGTITNSVTRAGSSLLVSANGNVTVPDVMQITPVASLGAFTPLMAYVGGGAAPVIAWYNSTSGTNEKISDIIAGANTLQFRLANDAYNSTNDWLTVTRSGHTSAQVYFGLGEVNIGSATDQGAFTFQNTGGLYQNGSVTMNLGSDATGDMYYRNSGGALTRLGVGTDGDVLTLASGLPSWAALGATTIYNGDGTLTGNRTLTQGANTFTITGTGAMEILGNRALNIGTGASPLSSVNITSNGRLGLFSGITYGTDADNTDADYTVAGNTIIAEITPNLTADRTLTLPTASVNGQTITLVMRFSVDLDTYSLAAAVTDNATGTTFTQLDWGKTYDFMVDQSLAWRLIRKY
jgi:hypothetical protein